MPEYLILAGDPVEVPAEIVSDSRAAVDAWYKAHPGYVPPPPAELIIKFDDPKKEADRLARLDKWNADQLAQAKIRVQRAADAGTAKATPAAAPTPAAQAGTE